MKAITPVCSTKHKPLGLPIALESDQRQTSIPLFLGNWCKCLFDCVWRKVRFCRICWQCNHQSMSHFTFRIRRFRRERHQRGLSFPLTLLCREGSLLSLKKASSSATSNLSFYPQVRLCPNQCLVHL